MTETSAAQPAAEPIVGGGDAPTEGAGDLAAARRLLDLEADGLRRLAAGLDDSFVRALNVLQAVSGRVVVTGMGKSGHIGRKIAATLASTGTPAQFVHPGEASHGDLGMITRKDAVLALSNSGGTAELGDIVGYTRRYRIPLVALTANSESSLAEQADVAVPMPRAAEGCPMGLAPTTSTTMTLALGDALAIALLERRGFSPNDFQVFHPGGSLGQRLQRVGDLMHGIEELPLCRAETPMSQAILTMTAKTWGCVGIVNDRGALVGIVTDGDLRRNIDRDLLKLTAGEVMTADPETIRMQALAAEALGLMNARKVHCLFVVDGAAERETVPAGGVTARDVPVGIVRIHDCLHAGLT